MSRVYFLLLMLLLVSACSRQPLVPDSVQVQAWQKHQSMLMGLKDWKLQGRVGLYTADEAWPGDLHWQQAETKYDMRIIGPMGSGSLHVYSVEGGVMLEQSSDARAHFSADPEALIMQEFGWVIPVRNLRYWMTGIPNPRESIAGELDLDSQGRLKSLRQSGWYISFPDYKNIAGYDLPAKVLLEHQDLSVKIVIRKWQL